MGRRNSELQNPKFREASRMQGSSFKWRQKRKRQNHFEQNHGKAWGNSFDSQGLLKAAMAYCGVDYEDERRTTTIRIRRGRSDGLCSRREEPKDVRQRVWRVFAVRGGLEWVRPGAARIPRCGP
jgi:hypothetical protein